MNTKIILPIIILMIFSLNSFSQGFIIDHTCTDIDAIPDNYIQDVKENINWHFAHTSHGHSLTCGLETIENGESFFDHDLGFTFLPENDSAMCIYDGNWLYTYINPDGYYRSEYGMSLTRGTLNDNPTINVSAFAWCTQMDEFTPPEVQQYLDSISSLEADFPNVTFIYFTGNAQALGPQGQHRLDNNNIIRQYCIDNNKILFDFADLDCWYNDDMFYYIHNGDTIPKEHPAFDGDSCGHVNSLSNVMKGNAVWWMMARIRGWNPETTRVGLKVMMEGPFNGVSMNTELSEFPLAQPFNVAPWNYPGNESIEEVALTAVDWLLVELRDTTFATLANASTVIESKAAILLSDGTIMDIDGKPILHFNSAIKNNLFVVLRHRNHLDIMSSEPLTLSNGVYTYDFTSDGNKAYGNNTAHKELADGVWGMIAGDADADGTINTNDKTAFLQTEIGQEGYLNSDFNLDTQSDNKDKNQYWGVNLGAGCQVPE